MNGMYDVYLNNAPADRIQIQEDKIVSYFGILHNVADNNKIYKGIEDSISKGKDHFEIRIKFVNYKVKWNIRKNGMFSLTK